MSSTRIKGAALSLSFGGTDYWADVTKVTLENDEQDSGAVTFQDAAGTGGRQFSIKGSAIQSLQTTSFWRYVWSNSGQTVAYRYAPAGNAVASADQPHFVGTVKIGAKPTVGGEAGAGNEFTFDFEWEVQGLPTLDDGTDGTATISTISPTGQQAGKQVVISGTRFTGTTDVKFGTTSATSIIVVSDTTLAVVIPTGTGVKAVTIVNSAGTSDPVNYTVAT
jgi:hypothetical protein